MSSGNDGAKEGTNTRALAKKVLILGLDGATFDVLTPLMDAGRMPNLKRMVDNGASGTMYSTVPPITPAAWTTFMTGKGPGTHGIIDFERYDVHTNQLSFNTTNALQHVRTVWRVLGDKGYRVGCVNIPMTYPPIAVNGFLISGFEAVNTENEFTHPADLKQELLQRWPKFTFKNKWQHGSVGRNRIFEGNLDDITRSFHQGAEVVEFCGEKYGWDVLMVVFKMVDNLQHKVWRHIDPRTRDIIPQRRKLVEDCFAELDNAIGKIMDYADRHGAHIFMMSDHGHGSLEGKVQPNLMLKEWGYLKLRKGAAQAKTRTKHITAKLFRKKGKFSAGNFSLEDDLAVDFSNTQAAVMHAGMAGFLYINLKGRQETGIVEPDDYEKLRDELKHRLENVTCNDPSGQPIRVFDAVHKPEELYGCSREGRNWLPDLMLCPRPALSVVRKIKGSGFIKWIPLEKMEGTHRSNGVFAVYGEGVAKGKKVDTNIINSTPTILAMMGLGVPQDMEGTVIVEAFDPPLSHEIDTSPTINNAAADGVPQEVYSPEELAKLTERLADLGYLE